MPTLAAEGGQAVLERLIQAIELQLSYAQQNGYVVSGVGIDAAGCIDTKRGRVHYASDLMPGWTGQEVVATITERLALPASIIGDVHAHALGEARWGSAQKAESALVVAVGTGLGGAYIHKGHVLTGTHGAAGHLGHTLCPEAKDYQCSCGAYGHVESLTSGTGIGALYQGVSAMSPDYKPEHDGLYVSRRAEEGDSYAQETLRRSGYILGSAIGSWVNAFDPEIVILSGTVLAAGPLWRRGIEEGFADQAIEAVRTVGFVEATLKGGAPLLGAAEHFIDIHM